jgi:hypothetical protein
MKEHLIQLPTPVIDIEQFLLIAGKTGYVLENLKCLKWKHPCLTAINA